MSRSCRPSKVLVACEFSGIVRDAFTAQGHDAWSCDLLPSERPGNHIQGDALSILGDGWDLLIAHPPCTYLSVSGMHWTTRGLRDPQLTEDALEFVRRLLSAPIPHIALENPVSIISSRIRKPDQIIQPWQFGHGETKAICLWLTNLPPLQPTHLDQDLFCAAPPVERAARVLREPPAPDRWKKRSRFFHGIAVAMATQWGAHADQSRNRSLAAVAISKTDGGIQ